MAMKNWGAMGNYSCTCADKTWCPGRPENYVFIYYLGGRGSSHTKSNNWGGELMEKIKV